MLLTYADAQPSPGERSSLPFRWRRFLWGCWRWFGAFLLLGVMQGLTRKEFAQAYPAQATAFDSGDPDYVIPGGESARQRHQRSVECVQELAARHQGQTIAIVAHGGVLKSLFCKTTNLPLAAPRHFSLFNASINVFSINGRRWRLDTWGDIHHLAGIDTLDDN